MTRTLVRERPASPAGPAGNGASAAPAAPLALASSKRRQPTWTVVGVVMIGLAALLGAWWFSAATDTMRVLVAAHDLVPGEVVAADDLRVVEVGRSSELRALSPDQQGLIVGEAARGPIPAGTVLNTDLFSDRDRVIPEGMVVVGAALPPGALPNSSLTAGDRVNVLGVVKTTGTESSEAVGRMLATGTVWSVDGPASSGGSSAWWVSLLVPADTEAVVAQAASDGLLRLSIVGVPE